MGRIHISSPQIASLKSLPEPLSWSTWSYSSRSSSLLEFQLHSSSQDLLATRLSAYFFSTAVIDARFRSFPCSQQSRSSWSDFRPSPRFSACYYSSSSLYCASTYVSIHIMKRGSHTSFENTSARRSLRAKSSPPSVRPQSSSDSGTLRKTVTKNPATARTSRGTPSSTLRRSSRVHNPESRAIQFAQTFKQSGLGDDSFPSVGDVISVQ